MDMPKRLPYMESTYLIVQFSYRVSQQNIVSVLTKGML